MTKASNYFENIMDSRTVAKSALTSTDTKYLNIGDVISTPIYAYQSVPLTIGGTPTTKYIQTIRAEVLDAQVRLYPQRVVDNNNILWAWGTNANGNLGCNTTTEYSSAVSVLANNVQQIATAPNGFVGVYINSSGYAWGWGVGPVGDGTVDNRA